jgi:hypothetical protein
MPKTTQPRRQLNIRLDNYPFLYDAIKETAHQRQVSVSSLVVESLRLGLAFPQGGTPMVLHDRIDRLEQEVAALRRRFEEDSLA